MTKRSAAAAATAITSNTPAIADDPISMWDDMFEAPETSAKPELKLVHTAPEAPMPPAVTEAISEELTELRAEPTPNPAPAGLQFCKSCKCKVNASIPGAWSAEFGKCTGCAAPELRKARKAEREARKAAKEAARKAAHTCKCGNPKSPDFPTCKKCAPKRAQKQAPKGRRNTPQQQAERDWRRRQSHLQCQGVGCKGKALPGVGFCKQCLTG